MRKFPTAAILLATLTTAACNQGQGSGPRVSRNYQVGNFQQIEVAGSYDVEVHTGPNVSVSAQGGKNVLDRTVVEVSDGKLEIHSEKNNSFFSFGHHGHAKFIVTVPQLSGATIAGSGDMKIDRVQGNGFDGTVAGSGSIQIGAADLQQLKLSIAGSGDAKAEGKAKSAEYSVAGSGDIDAARVQTQDVKVDIAGSGDIKVHAVGTAQVSIMGSGGVDVSGGAKCQVDKAGSGTVRCS